MNCVLRCLRPPVPGPVQVGAVLPRGTFHAGAITPLVDGVRVEDADVEVVSTWDDGSACLVRVVMPSGGQRLIELAAAGNIAPALGFFPSAPSDPSLVFDPCSKRREMLEKYFAKVTIVDAGGVTWVAEVQRSQSWQVLQALIAQADQGPARRTIEFSISPRAISDHPQLRVRFRWTAFSGFQGALCDVAVENCLVDAGRPTADLAIASVIVEVGEQGEVIARSAHTHEHGTVWRAEAWSGLQGNSVLAVPFGREAAEEMLCPDWDWASPAEPADARAMWSALTAATAAGSSGRPYRGRRAPLTPMELELGVPGEPWPLWGNQGDTGDRDDIGWAPTWTAGMLNGGHTEFLRLQAEQDCNGSGAFNVHFRDGDDQPMGVRHGHPHWAKGAPPRRGTYVPDVAHHVTAGLWSWIMTARERYFEELRTWACFSVRLNFKNDGTLQNPGDRREAWALRSMATCMRFAPDDDAIRAYLRSCLERTAAEFDAMVPSMQSQLPLGHLNDGDWKPSGREQYAFTFVGSPWMQAWFLSQAIAADRLMQGSLFRGLVEQGWKYFQMYAEPPGGPSNFDRDMLADYSVPTTWYEPGLDAAGKWTVKSVGPAFIDAQDFAAACRVALRTHKKQLTAADLATMSRELTAADVATSYVGSQFHAYGIGRCGTDLLARRVGLPRADEVLAVSLPLVKQREVATKREHYARVAAPA